MIRTHANRPRHLSAPLWSIVLLVTGFSLAASGCSQPTGSYECLAASDCPASQACLAGACVAVDASTDVGDDAADVADDVPIDTAVDVEVDVTPDISSDVPDDTVSDPIEPDVPEPRCGDGALNPGEQCDTGANNSNDRPDACRTDCTYPRCGDAVIDSSEECELNESAPDGWRCSFDTCRYTLESSCVTCGQCLGADTYCAGGYCTQDCSDDNRCPFGSDCIENTCVLRSVGVCTGEICDILGDEDLDGDRECDDSDCFSNPICAEIPCEPDIYEPNNTAENPTSLSVGRPIFAEICGVEHDFFSAENNNGGDSFALRLDFISSEYSDLDVLFDSGAGMDSFAEYGMEFGTVEGSEALIDVFNFHRRPDSVAYRLELLPVDDSGCPIDTYGNNHSVNTPAPLSPLGVVYPVVCSDGATDAFALTSGPTPGATGRITFTTNRTVLFTATNVVTGRVLLQDEEVSGAGAYLLTGSFEPNEIVLQVSHPGASGGDGDLSPIAYEIQASY